MGRPDWQLVGSEACRVTNMWFDGNLLQTTLWEHEAETGIECRLPGTCELTSWCGYMGEWSNTYEGTHLQHLLLTDNPSVSVEMEEPLLVVVDVLAPLRRSNQLVWNQNMLVWIQEPGCCWRRNHSGVR